MEAEKMTYLYEDLKQGLEEAVAYEKGLGTAQKKIYTIVPVKEYSNKEIREIRMKAGMTQSVFALYMGVSKKTVEAWEGGRSHPNGSAFRLLEVLSTSDPNVTDYVVVDE
jgi:putative transcriptional regulator